MRISSNYNQRHININRNTCVQAQACNIGAGVSTNIISKKPGQKVSFNGYRLNSLYTAIFKKPTVSELRWVFTKPKLINFHKIDIINKHTGKSEQMFITEFKHTHNLNRETGLAIISKNGAFQGYIGILDSVEHTILNNAREPYLRLHKLMSFGNSKYKEIGTKLIQAAIEKSLDMELGGRLRVEAFNDVQPKSPFEFYLKKGFEFEDAEKSIDFYKSAFQKHVELAKKNSLKMYLNKCDELDTKYRFGAEKLYTDMINIRTKEDNDKIFKIFLSHYLEPMYLNTHAVRNIWLPKIKENPILGKAV